MRTIGRRAVLSAAALTVLLGFTAPLDPAASQPPRRPTVTVYKSPT
jgi:hypothetical protein